MKKLLLIGNVSSIHFQKIIHLLSSSSLSERYYVVSHSPKPTDFPSNIKFIRLPCLGPFQYILCILPVICIVSVISPSLINIHYASGYGFYCPFLFRYKSILSVWGSDVLIFPNKSLIHYWLVKINLLCCNLIASTSPSMLPAIRRLAPSKKVLVTPFGLNTAKFQPLLERKPTYKSKFVLGTIKSLKYVYGIDLLIRFFHSLTLSELANHIDFHLCIVGDGDQAYYLHDLVKSLSIQHKVSFIGAIENAEIPKYIDSFDVCVFLSRSESYGVSLLECMSCEKVVISSATLGPSIFIENGHNGFLISHNDVNGFISIISDLVSQPTLLTKVGHEARNTVLQYYSNEASLEAFSKAFSLILDSNVN